MQAWKVHKFGGSSVADAACMLRVAKIIENDPAPRKAVVLSACRGVTDALLTLISLAEQDSPVLDDRLQELRQRHIGIARELLAGELCDEYLAALDVDCRDIAGILQTVRLVRNASTTMRDLIAGYRQRLIELGVTAPPSLEDLLYEHRLAMVWCLYIGWLTSPTENYGWEITVANHIRISTAYRDLSSSAAVEALPVGA